MQPYIQGPGKEVEKEVKQRRLARRLICQMIDQPKKTRIFILSAVTRFLMETVSGTRYESEVSN